MTTTFNVIKALKKSREAMNFLAVPTVQLWEIEDKTIPSGGHIEFTGVFFSLSATPGGRSQLADKSKSVPVLLLPIA